MTSPLLVLCAGGCVVLTGISSTLEPRQQRNAPAGTAVVTGRVVDAVDGAAVPFARIDMSMGTSLNGSQRGEALADEHGSFAVERLIAGRYFLAASKAGYAATYFASTGSTTVAPGDTLSVSGTEPVKPIEIRLVRGGVISGRVIDEFGQPAPRAVFIVQQMNYPGGPSPFYFSSPQGSTLARANGEFRISGLAEGEYIVSAQAQGSDAQLRLGSSDGPRVSHVLVFYPDTTDRSQARPVLVRVGEERSGIDIRLRLASVFTVSGTFAIPANINPSQPLTSMWLTGDRLRDLFVSRTADGRFEAQNVVPGQYSLTSYAYEQGPSKSEQGALLWGALPVTVVDRDVRDLVLAFQPSLTIEGVIVDDTGGPTQQLNVTAVPISRIVDVPARPGRPDASGKFLIRDLTPGRYRLRIGTGPNWNTEITEIAATLAGQTLQNRELEIAAGANITGLALRITK